MGNKSSSKYNDDNYTMVVHVVIYINIELKDRKNVHEKINKNIKKILIFKNGKKSLMRNNRKKQRNIENAINLKKACKLK